MHIKLSPARKLVIEMLHHARKVPSIPVARGMNIEPTLHAREDIQDAPSWTAIFMRAYALVALRVPELRRCLMPWWRWHLYEHPFSIGALVVERELDGEPALLAAKIRAPENCTLSAISQRIRYLKETPVWEVSEFRQLLRLGKIPGFVRRFLFWQSLTWSGARRAKRFGTFMVSSYGSLGAEQVHPITPLTTLLTFGPISPDGDVNVKIIYDHRVMDGRRVAHALGLLEQVMQGQIVDELRACRAKAA
jgi:hypothetical protein